MAGLIIIVILAGVLAFLVWASADISSGIYVRALCRKKTEEKVVALTFDYGPDGDSTERVLDVLGKYGVHATFFLIGKKAEQYPELVRRMVEEGHTIGMHTYSHSPFFPLWNSRKVKAEIEENREALYRITGRRVRLFRPPFGVTNPIIGKVLKQSGYDCIGWSIRSFDTVERKERSSILEKIDRRLSPGDIVLLHDRCPGADRLVEDILKMMADKGFRPVSADKLLEINSDED